MIIYVTQEDIDNARVASGGALSLICPIARAVQRHLQSPQFTWGFSTGETIEGVVYQAIEVELTSAFAKSFPYDDVEPFQFTLIEVKDDDES